MHRAIARRRHPWFAANKADHRQRRHAGGTARCVDSNFTGSPALHGFANFGIGTPGYSTVGRRPSAIGSMFGRESASADSALA
jgi:hypothetical protein